MDSWADWRLGRHNYSVYVIYEETQNAALAEITDPVAFRAVDVTADEHWTDIP